MTMVFLDTDEFSPGAQVSESTYVDLKDTTEVGIRKNVTKILAWDPDVITAEWENVPAALLRAIEET